MNHNEAVSKSAAERYLLGQLSESEVEEFEEHFFDCLECSRDVRAGAIFEENARALVLDEGLATEPNRQQNPRATKQSSFWVKLWQSPWALAPALAGLAVAAIAAFQAAVVIPGLRGELHEALAPQAIASNVLPPISRGDTHVLEVPANSRFYTIYMDPTWDGSFQNYDCVVEDQSGSTKFDVSLPAPAPGKPIQILMARSLLPSGRYTVIIRNAAQSGKTQMELARYTLVLKLT